MSTSEGKNHLRLRGADLPEGPALIARPLALPKKARRYPIILFEIPGKMRQLLITGIECYLFDRFALKQAFIRPFKPKFPQPVADRAAVVFLEMPF